MTLSNYYSQVVDQIFSGNYTIKIRNRQNTNLPSQISPTAQALHYLMYQYLQDMRFSKKEKSDYYNLVKDTIFEKRYIIIPNNLDFDFRSITIMQLLQFIQFLKPEQKLLIPLK